MYLDPDARDRAIELVELDRTECLALLASTDLGRVIFTSSAMPAARPVTYVLDGEEVLFRTADGRMRSATHHAVVGFEADDIEPLTRTGWSVLGVGQAYEVMTLDRRGSDGHPGSRPPACPTHVIAIPLRHLTGSRLRPVTRRDDADAPAPAAADSGPLPTLP